MRHSKLGAGQVIRRWRAPIAATWAVALGLVVVAAVLATSITAKPNSGPRDDGNNNQTHLTVSGDLSDTITTGFTNLGAYWDLPNTSTPDSSHLMTNNGWSIDATGVFTVPTEVPLYDANVNPVRPGAHNVTVCATPIASTNGVPICLTTVFTVASGVANLSPTSGRPGQTVTVDGSRWVPGNADEAIRLIWAPAGAALTLSETFFPSSTWQTTFNVPNVPPGTYTVRICNVSNSTGSCVAKDTLDKTFTVVRPVVSLAPTSGLPGATVNISGSRFLPATTVRLYFGPPGAAPGDPSVVEISPGTSKSTGDDGTFGPYPYAPPNPPGNYIVTACTLTRIGCNPNDTDTAPYTVLAPPTPTPTPSPTPRPTASPSPTPRPTATPSPTPSPTASPTASPSATSAASPSPTTVVSPSPSPSAGTSPTLIPSSSPSSAPTASATQTASPAPSAIPATPAAPSPSPTAEPLPSPTSAPSPSQGVVKQWPEHLRTPGSPTGGSLDLAAIGGISLLALLIAFLVPFPGTLFNKTVEANYAEIVGWFNSARDRWNRLLDRVAVGPLTSVRRGLGRALSGRLGVVIFLALSALVYGFLSPTFGFDWNSAALFLGLLVGLAFITAAFDLPLRIYHRRRSKEHDGGVLRALWWTLLVAVVCVVVSRLAGFQPGYLYGLIISIVFVTEITTRDEGVGTWLASLWLLMLSFVAWVALAFVRAQSPDPWLSLFLQTVLVTFVVAGIETLAIGLLPMRFLPGHPLFRWRKSMWFALFALSVFGYLLILVDPANGYLSDDSRTPMMVGVIFLVAFGVVSLGTWAYFRYRPARVGGDRPGEVSTA